MKRLAAVILILAMMSGCAWADVFTVDTETATVEEIEAVIEVLQKAVKEKKGETGPETYVFSEGYTVSVVGVDKYDGEVTVHFVYSHTQDMPRSVFGCFNVEVYQRGVLLSNVYRTEDYESYSRSILRDTLFEFTQTYPISDNSPITVMVRPWSSYSEAYTVTIDLE